MSESFWLSTLKQERAIAVIRAPTFELGQQMARAVAMGGMRLIEITWNSDRAPELIASLRSELPNCLVGTGTLLTRAQLQSAIAAGAQFLFTPHVDFGLIQLALQQGVPIVPGALSPTEIVTAWQAGASSVKVFPVQAVGGATYIRNLQGPLGQIPLIPTGGVTVENAKDFLAAGAIAVGLSGNLFPAAAIQAGNWPAIAQQARILCQQVANVSIS
ncbi:MULTISPECIES: bifunctional 4-hydroxy-2-oxoglutarate aldolase/2-dehydro-3-deoxy-phosphogluconate aldolase [Trichocoleus]|uniref:Bifunctional 4-hydroxy-2-oxoglutarate aldolase/2-dehydro-3-deoxy-phosphogluconate aldolase n=1 Tax=Trichocoleus desertorum GB2-A4 TaxID=2933944 RepID=A0ABV0JGE2_9CYAN|nr:bifunctional 4-hydroxy-2-oxoglutarate aldolase/2-dehydro-3-deoxy-phosphogluconate aldolase [Trichocoleus sp. FACHB-46]MBD1864562.1 bifunctional 4-hydroxy-2-oxoglutarate aldolase/2-dehydro-3-deoxy-phosphogluconate aldolase [Trichocoleus sp. FACHB-46]